MRRSKQRNRKPSSRTSVAVTVLKSIECYTDRYSACVQLRTLSKAQDTLLGCRRSPRRKQGKCSLFALPASQDRMLLHSALRQEGSHISGRAATNRVRSTWIQRSSTLLQCTTSQFRCSAPAEQPAYLSRKQQRCQAKWSES